MSAPNNARKVIRRVIMDKIIMTPGVYMDKDVTESDVYKVADTIACRIRNVGYRILEEKYRTDDVNICVECYGEYQSMFEKVCMAINETDVLPKLIDKSMKSAQLLTSTLDEIFPSANREVYEDIEFRLNIKVALKTSKMYVCECGCNETVTMSKQTRGADEAPTVTAKCVRCNRKWQPGK
jgi:DNA-directed RNA polymerase subunit M/transcription elongation factor TFIIS